MFCMKLGKSATETFEIIKKAFEAISRSKTFEWYKRFSEGHEATSDTFFNFPSSFL